MLGLEAWAFQFIMKGEHSGEEQQRDGQMSTNIVHIVFVHRGTDPGLLTSPSGLVGFVS